MKNVLPLLGLLLGLAATDAVPLGTGFSYQGRLDDGAASANGLYDFNFKLYDADTGGTLLGPGAGVSTNAVAVTGGVFTVYLDFGGVFTGPARWLEISVNTNLSLPLNLLAPRQPVLPAPYALFSADAAAAASVAAGSVNNGGLANNAVTGAKIANGSVVRSVNGLTDALTLAAGANIALNTIGNTVTISGTGGGSAWLLGGNPGTTAGINYLGTTDNQALELKANSTRALRIEPRVNSPNVILGHPANSVAAASYGASIGGGGTTGQGNVITSTYGTIAGGVGNSNTANYASMGGGNGNLASGQDGVVAGGSGNAAMGGQSTVSGGIGNRAGGSQSTVSGGAQNNALSLSSSVLGGQLNSVGAGGDYAVVLGGNSNTNLAPLATVLNGSGVLADKYGQVVFGTRFATNGDAQASFFHLRGTTTGATTSDLSLNGSGARLTVPRHSGWAFRALVVGKALNTPAAAAFEIRGLVVNVDASTTVFTTTTALGSYAGIAGFNATAVADDANDALLIRVTSPVAANVRWSAQVETAEVNAPSTLF